MKQILRNTIFIGLFAIPFIPFLVSSSLFFPFITTKAFAWRIIIEIVFAAWLALALMEPDYRPKKSPILYLILGFLVVIGLADLLGAAPIRSIWSNFERMEGYVSLLHLGAFFVVISSVFKEADWKRWWNTTLIASFVMVLFCVMQILGVKTINQGGVRVDGTFGNAIYLAVYMLFHVFIAILLLTREWKNKSLRWMYGVLILLQIIIIYYTATRGAILGLLGGLVIFSLLNIRNREELWARKLSLGVIAGLVILMGGFFAIRHTQFVQSSPVLSRFANLSSAELKSQGRYFVWPMAWQGIKERPLFGWGQENFNYVFQKHYSPEMYNLEPWFDRAHNVFLDWAIAGGLLGFVIYFALYVVAINLVSRRDKFSSLEKSILISLIAAYFFHNLFVFDHLFSYILFFALLAYIHERNASELLWRTSLSFDKARNVILPAVSITLVLCLYFVNWKPLKANLSLIDALRSAQSGQPERAIESFERAYTSSALGRQEVVEQLINNATGILSSQLPMEEKNQFFVFAQSAVLEQASELPDDARGQLLAGLFFINFGSLEEGIKYLERAKELSPTKQELYFQIGGAYINKNEPQKALEALRIAYELAPEYTRAKALYLVGAIYASDRALESALLAELSERELAFDDAVIGVYYNQKRFADVIRLLEIRKKFDPANVAAYDQYIKQIQTQK